MTWSYLISTTKRSHWPPCNSTMTGRLRSYIEACASSSHATETKPSQLSTDRSIRSTAFRGTLLFSLPDKRVVSVYQVTFSERDGKRRTVLPLVPAYALTVCKAQGQTLAALVVWFHCDTVPQGTSYVAMLRVKHLHDCLCKNITSGPS